MSSKAMFLLDQCIASDTSSLANYSFTLMLHDAAYLNAACVAIQTYYDRALSRIRDAKAQRRDRECYGKAVRMLQERLDNEDDSVRLSDSTFMTVLSLSGQAYTTGDYEAVLSHNRGLLTLVSMRGVETFVQTTKLLIEIIRYVFSVRKSQFILTLVALAAT